jgi:hypothetical protein
MERGKQGASRHVNVSQYEAARAVTHGLAAARCGGEKSFEAPREQLPKAERPPDVQLLFSAPVSEVYAAQCTLCRD